MSITVQEFFPEVKNNLTMLSWAHRTNNKTALMNALNSNSTHMIEADVIMGTMGNSNNTLPIMGHPPANTSDLSLQQFLKDVLANKKKGVKLDFKSIEALQHSIKILQATADLDKIPVWLNGDILKGPMNAAPPLDAATFLAEAAKLPKTVLSVGWTTNVTHLSANTTANYTSEQINEMLKLVTSRKNTNQSITYPVRAIFAANDKDGFKRLLNNTAMHTLTIWSLEGDVVNATLLSKVIKNIGLDKVYLDVPATLYQKLDLSNSAPAAKNSLIILLAAMITTFFSSRFL
ncbi:protein FAM151A isoform X2 [Copidosoma floridanum]|nr:protein FAM151A isoform X2 [Copidosoma floridanum]